MVRFTFLTGDRNYLGYGGKWISNRINHGDFDFWLVAELINWEDAVGEREAKEVGAKYNLSLSVVAPSQPSRKEIMSACNCMGFDIADWDTASYRVQVEVLHGYGVYAQIWNENGNSFRKLWKQMRHEAYMQGDFLFGS
jgi:hypothetical protein